MGDLVVNAKAKNREGGSGPRGKGCKLCKYMQRTEMIKDKEGKEMRIEERMDCRTIGAIYGMHCKKCQKVVYVGKTKNKIMERFNGHRADLKTGAVSYTHLTLPTILLV